MTALPHFISFLRWDDKCAFDKWLAENKQACPVHFPDCLTVQLSTWCPLLSASSALHCTPMRLMAGPFPILMIMNSVITKHRYEMHRGAAEPSRAGPLPPAFSSPRPDMASRLPPAATADVAIYMIWPSHGFIASDETRQASVWRMLLPQPIAQHSCANCHLPLVQQHPLNGYPKMVLVGAS